MKKNHIIIVILSVLLACVMLACIVVVVKLLSDNRTSTAENNYFIPYESTDSGLSEQDWITLLSNAGFFNLSSGTPMRQIPFEITNMMPGDPSYSHTYTIDVKDQNAVELKLDLALSPSSEPLAKVLNVRIFIATKEALISETPFFEGTFYELAQLSSQDQMPVYTLPSKTTDTVCIAIFVDFPAHVGNENEDGQSLQGQFVKSNFQVAVSREPTGGGGGGTTILSSSSTTTSTTTSATTTSKTTTSQTTTTESEYPYTSSVTVTVDPGTTTSKSEPTTSQTVTVDPGTTTSKPEPTTSQTVTVDPGTTTSKPEPTTSESVTIEPGTETTTEPTSSVTVTTEPIGSETTTEPVGSETTTDTTEPENECHINLPWCATGIGTIDMCPWCWLLPLLTIIGAALIVTYHIIKAKGGKR